MEKTLIKYVQTTARIICSPYPWWTEQEVICLVNAARKIQVRYENYKDGEAQKQTAWGGTESPSQEQC